MFYLSLDTLKSSHPSASAAELAQLIVPRRLGGYAFELSILYGQHVQVYGAG